MDPKPASGKRGGDGNQHAPSHRAAIDDPHLPAANGHAHADQYAHRYCHAWSAAYRHQYTGPVPFHQGPEEP